MKKKILWTLLFVLAAYFIAIYSLNRKIDKWDWTKINVEDISFPKGFVWGVASASFQVEGGHGPEDSWGWWETQKDKTGKPRTIGTSGICNDEWHMYPVVIKNIKELGLNSYRFSLSWTKIEPAEGQFNAAALMHYDTLINALLANGIAPMITFHHFSHPQWFEQKGAFDKQENLKYYIRFVDTCFRRYGDRVKMFGTFNEPVVYGYGRHIDLKFPTPYDKPDFNRLGAMLKNILIAHDSAYKLIKTLPHGNEVQVGIVKNIMQMDPYSKFDFGDQILAHFAEKLYTDALLGYFEKGVFDFAAFPVGANVVYKKPDPKEKTLDFIGLNYYSNLAFDLQYPKVDIEKASKPLVYPKQEKTDMDYGFYPEGLYRAIKRISRVKAPIYVTENGIGLGPEREALRTKHLKTALYDVSKAIKEGYDVRGYYYWSLDDNFEWDSGFTMQFGLYSVERPSLERKPKATALYFRDVLSKLQSK